MKDLTLLQSFFGVCNHSLYRMAANRFLRDPEHAFDSGVLVMGDTPMPQVRAGAIREPLGSH